MPKTINLEQLLDYAVQAGWNDLEPAATLAQVRVEYHPGGDVPLEFVKVWASTVRGTWSLVCEYWPLSLWSRPIGLTFSNQYYSEGLVQAFAAVARTPDAFPRGASNGFDGFLLVENVTAEEQAQAERQLANALRDAQLLPVIDRAHEDVYAT
jgi:hypothetical protein